MQKVDWILRNGIVLTMDDERTVIQDGAVAVRGSDIVAVGAANEVTADYQAAEVLDCSGCVIMPGLINAHTHVPMSLLRGLADDLRLDVWLHGYMLPVEKEFVNEEFCRLGTLLSCAEMIRSGVTCFADMYYFENEVARAAAEVGMRAICGETIMKVPTPDAASYDESLAYCQDFLAHWQGHELIIAAPAPHSTYMCTPEILHEATHLAQAYGVPLLIHLSETADEVENSLQGHKRTPVEYAADEGVFAAQTVAAHCVHIDESEMALLARHGVGVAHNPTSNLKLGSGVANVAGMMAAGVHVGLGTDGPASNNDQDMFEEMRLAALLPKGVTGDPVVMPAESAVALATIEGARALHIAHLTGSLEVGKRADIAVVDLRELHNAPRFDISARNIYSQLVYAAKSHDVCHVMINGRMVMRDRRLLTVDEQAVMAEAQRIAARVSAFLSAREGNLLDKLVAIGGLEWRETFEVQVKVRVHDLDALEQRLIFLPGVIIQRHTVRDQYDTYFFFADPGMGRIRYREDEVMREGEVPHAIYTLTLTGPTHEREYDDSIVLSRSRFSAIADRSLRFYREYFQPTAVKEVVKHRRRYRILYREVDFAINLDALPESAGGGSFLEIKSRTWSKADAERKAELIGELLSLLQVDRAGVVKQEYVDMA
ncbi:MAG: amidohydrolase family protein [Anaerolineae bacterium]|jgi:5-methylthioadenosine/S-adenosylhomocysteine deaminase|nr:amidohydrolase family protein [Anaerolineae bacterium]MDH7475284.1 amidohydrolase family protein [Anaerolineae bacterium]